MQTRHPMTPRHPVSPIHTHNARHRLRLIEYVKLIQGGEDPWDALDCGSLSAKEPLIIGLFCGE